MSALTCKRADLAWALKAVKPHAASTGDYLPVLYAIQLEVRPAESSLYAIATDRYSAGCARIDITGDHREFEVTIDLREVPDLLRKLTGKGTCTLALYDTEIVLDDFYRFRPGHNPPGFPNVRKVLGDMVRKPPEIPGKDMAIDGAKLARFSAARPAGHSLVVMPVHAATVVLADNFVGTLMHMRGQDGKNPQLLRRWRELIPAAKKASTTS